MWEMVNGDMFISRYIFTSHLRFLKQSTINFHSLARNEHALGNMRVTMTRGLRESSSGQQGRRADESGRSRMVRKLRGFDSHLGRV
jgi:hypothetical protein